MKPRASLWWLGGAGRAAPSAALGGAAKDAALGIAAKDANRTEAEYAAMVGWCCTTGDMNEAREAGELGENSMEN